VTQEILTGLAIGGLVILVLCTGVMLALLALVVRSFFKPGGGW
jgi:hypothetical protein